MERLKKISGPPVDRISTLSVDILVRILSFLPTKQAVATSILSRSWKSLWTRVPALDFDYKDYGDLNLVQVINKVFLHNDAGKLDKFSLRCRPEFGAVEVSDWVRRAIARGVRHLDLALLYKFDKNAIPQPLPVTVFNCNTLVFLRLCGFFRVQTPGVVCLPKLEVLSLDLVFYESDESANDIIAGCPVLQSLTFTVYESSNAPSLKISSPSLRTLRVSYHYEQVSVNDDVKLEVDAPSLEFLCLVDNISKKFLFKRAKMLKEVQLDLEIDHFYHGDSYLTNDRVYIDGCNSIVETLKALDSVQVLELQGTIMRSLTYATIPLSATFDRLTKLNVECYCCNWGSLSVLLGCCIKLESLTMIMHYFDGAPHKKCWRDPEVVPTCLLSSLAQVTFGGFSFVKGQTTMIRYILKHGAVMKRLKILSDAKKLEKILSFPRSSPTCQEILTSGRWWLGKGKKRT